MESASILKLAFFELDVMRMRISTFFPTALLGLAALASSCSTTTEPGPNGGTDTSKITFTAAAKMTYTEQRLDTTGGTYGQDKPDPTSTDSVHSTVLDTSASAYGKTNVVVIYNARSRNASDTTYIWQDASGSVYQYNYGVDILNSIPAVVGFLGHRIEAGWVLQSKMSGGSSTWVAARDTEHVTLPIVGTVDVNIIDNATKKSDTTIAIAGSSTSAVHTQHVVTASYPLGTLTTIVIDCYVNHKYGVIRNTLHSFTVSGPTNAQVSGQERIMVSHP
jgi:hypothetical protein